MLLKRFIAIVGPLLIFSLLEVLFYNLSLILPLIIIVTVFLLIILKVLIREKLLSLDFWRRAILPILLLYVNLSLLLLVGSSSLRQAIIIVFTFLLILFLNNIFLFYYYPDKYRPGTLENITAFLNLLVFFLTALCLNAYSIFLNLPIWLLSAILLGVTTILILESFWLNMIKNQFKIVYLLVINIVIIEFFWALSFLPNNFYVNGLILTIIFYIIWGILKIKLLDKFEKRVAWTYLIIGTLLLIFIISTSSWS